MDSLGNNLLILFKKCYLIINSRSQGTIRDGLRCSTAKAYLRPASKRPNLHVALDAHVNKILIHDTTKEAYGVIFYRNGKQYMVFSGKEVILSAGAIQSPQILKLSGIGPKEELWYHSIPVLYNSPGVGENLQDHVAMGGANYLIKNPISNETLSFIIPKLLTIPAARQFIFDHTGPLYAMPACEVMAFVNTKFQNSNEDWPDIQFLMGSYADGSDGGLYGKKAAGMSDEYFSHVYESIIYKDAYMVVPLLMRPRSRGRILLKSNNPKDYPLIYANYFQDPYDLAVLVRSFYF